MDEARTFQPFGPAHLLAIVLTAALPFVLAGFIRKRKSSGGEKIVGRLLAGLLVVNYLGYAVYLRQSGNFLWENTLPCQLCDWAMVAVIVALLTGRERWLEVAYFWGIGGTLQAIITPNLRYGFPDVRFWSFFIGHSGIVIGILFLMLVRNFRPHFKSLWRVILWSEIYFVVTIIIDLITGVNYGFLLHKPEAASLLNILSDNWFIYLFQMHLVAWVFFLALYAPFAVYDLLKRGE